jgi:hypothetical protein
LGAAAGAAGMGWALCKKGQQQSKKKEEDEDEEKIEQKSSPSPLSLSPPASKESPDGPPGGLLAALKARRPIAPAVPIAPARFGISPIEPQSIRSGAEETKKEDEDKEAPKPLFPLRRPSPAEDDSRVEESKKEDEDEDDEDKEDEEDDF